MWDLESVCAEQAKQVGALADGVIVGSACVKTIRSSEKPEEAAKQFSKSFQDALNKFKM